MSKPKNEPTLEAPLAPSNDEFLVRAADYLVRMQSEDGSWHGDYGGPMFLLPLYVATARIVGLPIEQREQDEMLRYLQNHQNSDGGFGLHVEGHSMVFTTALNYVAARMLGAAPETEWLGAAREWLHQHGGPRSSASWGKYFLALLNLYEYEGVNPLLPELWLLPESLPVHPSRLWCHCRMVYLPLSYLYGRRARAEVDELTLQLRAELYDGAYEEVDWAAARNQVSAYDRANPRSALPELANQLLGRFERRCPSALRRRALSYVVEQVHYEDINTDYICIGPINKLLNTLVWHFEEPRGKELQRHLERMPDYLYQAEDGLKVNGYNNSRLWDTAFVVQAAAATGPIASLRPCLERAYEYIEKNQVLQDVQHPERCFRHPSKGGWPFSDLPHGWPISDCTAEGLKACLALEPVLGKQLPRWRLEAAVDLILSWQNEDGGWATYELTRGPAWLELLNTSDCFRDIMIDYSYVECTSACMQALAAYGERFPETRQRLRSAIERGRDFILSKQRPDGSWEGSWGVCFTYGTWFGIEGLRAAGMSVDAEPLRRAAAFLRTHQREDGSWGESVRSCQVRYYVPTDEGQVVMTSWALLGLIALEEADSEAVARGLQFLRRRQLPDGSFPPERIAGVFNKTCGIHYDNYLKIFPLWALAEAEAVLQRRQPRSSLVAPAGAQLAGGLASAC